FTASIHTLEGLTEGIPYDVYVRSDCGVDGYSDWTGPLTVTPAFTTVVTYTDGDIPTMYHENNLYPADFCRPEPTLTVEVPPGYQLSGLTVKYDMVARNYAWKREQVSKLYSPTLDIGEVTVMFGAGDSVGILSYIRSVSFVIWATGNV